MRLKAIHKNNLVKSKKIIADSIMDHLIPQSFFPKDTERDVWFLDQDIWREEHKSEYEKIVEECEDPKCRDHTVILYEGLSNQRTTCSSRIRSDDSHVEWIPRIMGFIHVRKVWQKEVITFSRIWEEEEAQLIIREKKMGAIEDQALTIQRRSLKQWGIWRTQLLKNLSSILAFG